MISIEKMDCTTGNIGENSPFFHIPIEIQEMIFNAINITNWYETNFGNLCLVHPFWASQIPHALLDRGENRDLIVQSLLNKAENNLTRITQSNHILSIAFKIKNLVLHGFNFFTDDQLQKVFEVFYNLEAVTIGFSDKLTAKGVVNAMLKVKSLKAFTLRCQMTNEGLADISKNFPNIEGVDLTLCRGITDEGLKNFFSDCRELKDFRFPRNITLKNVFVTLIPEHYPKLTSLDLSSLSVFDHDLFDTLCRKVPNLAHLALPKNQSFTEDGINALLRCPLQYIKFSGPANADSHVEPFIRKAVHLQSLHFSNCPELTDNICVALANYRPQLKHFTASGKITNKGLYTLVSSCNALEHLDLLESKVNIDAHLSKMIYDKLLHLNALFVCVREDSQLNIDTLGKRVRKLRISNAVINSIQTITTNEIFF